MLENVGFLATIFLGSYFVLATWLCTAIALWYQTKALKEANQVIKVYKEGLQRIERIWGLKI